MARYKVMIDDNYHHTDEEYRYEKGVYETAAQALDVCREVVERSVREGFAPGMPADELYRNYVAFGEDPFIIVLDGKDDSANFSAWNYAKELCRVVCGEN